MKFKEHINQDKPVLVDFFATWCGPCQTMAPILESVKKKLGDRVSILKIKKKKNQQAAAMFQIRSVPTLILFKQGKQLWKQAGVVPASDLERILKQHI